CYILSSVLLLVACLFSLSLSLFLSFSLFLCSHTLSLSQTGTVLFLIRPLSLHCLLHFTQFSYNQLILRAHISYSLSPFLSPFSHTLSFSCSLLLNYSCLINQLLTPVI